MNGTSGVMVAISISISIVLILYYYRGSMVDSVIKGKINLSELAGKNSLKRLPELFTIGLGIVIGLLLFGKLI